MTKKLYPERIWLEDDPEDDVLSEGRYTDDNISDAEFSTVEYVRSDLACDALRAENERLRKLLTAKIAKWRAYAIDDYSSPELSGTAQEYIESAYQDCADEIEDALGQNIQKDTK